MFQESLKIINSYNDLKKVLKITLRIINNCWKEIITSTCFRWVMIFKYLSSSSYSLTKILHNIHKKRFFFAKNISPVNKMLLQAEGQEYCQLFNNL